MSHGLKVLGEKLKEARLRHGKDGMSREHLAFLLCRMRDKDKSVSERALESYEQGQRCIPVDVLMDLASILGVDLDEIRRAWLAAQAQSDGSE